MMVAVVRVLHPVVVIPVAAKDLRDFTSTDVTNSLAPEHCRPGIAQDP
jgi:hypothetical protein